MSHSISNCLTLLERAARFDHERSARLANELSGAGLLGHAILHYDSGRVTVAKQNDAHLLGMSNRSSQANQLSKHQGLSYTAAVSLSYEDALKIREILFEATERAESIIENSPLQAVYCLTLDWFEL